MIKFNKEFFLEIRQKVKLQDRWVDYGLYVIVIALNIILIFMLTACNSKPTMDISHPSFAIHVGPYRSEVWVADQGDGTYKNPILFADYSNSDVIRVGVVLFMTECSYNCMPGLRILDSKDLVKY